MPCATTPGPHAPLAPGAVDADRTEIRTIRRGSWKLNVHASGEHELYDLRTDPAERHNAFADAEHAGVVRDLDRRLRQWQRETDDPLALPALA